MICKQRCEPSGEFQPNPFRKLSSVAQFWYGLACAKVSVHLFERLSFSENTDHAAPAPINSEAAMQYAHMGLQDRRDQNLDGSGSVGPLSIEPFYILTVMRR
jgi:hypothetical protein